MNKIKFFFALCIFSIPVISLFPQSETDEIISSISFSKPEISKDVPVTDSEIFAEYIRSEMEGLFSETTISVTDSDKENQSLAFQKSNSTAENISLASARYTAFTNVDKVADNYLLRLRIIDDQNGTDKSSCQENFTAEQLTDLSKFKYVIGTVSSKALNQLHIQLTQYQINCMIGKADENEITSDNLQEIINLTENQINDIDSKISSLKNQTGSSSDDNKKKILQLQSQKQKLVLKEQSDERKLLQKKDDEKRMEEESKIAMERNEKLNKIIAEQKKEYEKKASALRNVNLKAMNAEQQINTIEQNKQNIILMRQNSAQKTSDFETEILKNRDDDIQKINDAEYDITEKDADGNPIPRAINNRNAKITKIKQEANEKIIENEKQQQIILLAAETKTRSVIKASYPVLKKVHSVSSINDAELLRINNYDGIQFGWSSKINLSIGDEQIAEYTIFVPYKQMTGKRPKYDTTDYKDTVAEYDSYFRQGVPLVYAIVNYTVTPDFSYNPSQYIVSINQTKLYRIDTDKCISTITHKNLSGIYKAYPVSDIRNNEEIQNDNKILLKQQNAQDKAKQKIENEAQASLDKEIAENTRRENAAKAKIFLSPAKHGGVEAGYKKDLGGDSGAFAVIDITGKPVFFGIEATASHVNYPSSSSDSTEKSSSTFSDCTYDIGGRLGMHFSWFKQTLSPFIVFNGGIFLPGNSGEGISYFAGGTAGIHFFYIFNAAYTYRYYGNHDPVNSLSLSFAIVGPWD